MQGRYRPLPLTPQRRPSESGIRSHPPSEAARHYRGLYDRNDPNISVFELEVEPRGQSWPQWKKAIRDEQMNGPTAQKT